ncbi:hypothetical protein [Microbacterium plantarum]|uniref:hypothetical protein n=1 Tax=Microbacterium plantarum TaxID=1816425 RepID=UPI002B46BED9|nr:hypothetical protein [Microbacterium plantarum]WRK16514.1 hypothetical protein VC184_11410 [Microbacterium plantarum]
MTGAHENVGYLTWAEWDRFNAAVHRSLIIVPWLHAAGYIKGEVNEIRSPSSDHPLGLPPTWLAAEEIRRLSGELRYWANLEDVANDVDGADTARLFTREVETASARWPIEDRPHHVQHVRCQQCAGETIRYDPPRYDADEVKIACTECGRTYDDDEFTTLLKLVLDELERQGVKVGGTRRLGAA